MISIKLLSKENCSHIYTSYSDDIMLARKEALLEIYDKGWSHLNYKIIQCIKIIFLNESPIKYIPQTNEI